MLGWDQVPCMDLVYQGCGIDHFSWSMELTLDGKDLYPRLHEETAEVDVSEKSAYWRMGLETFRLYGKWLSSWAHCFHWTHHDEMAAITRERFEKIDEGVEMTRNDSQEKAIDEAEKCIGKDLRETFWQQPAFKDILSPPLFPTVGTMAISSMLRDAGEEIMVNMHAPGSIDNLQDEGIVLLTTRLYRSGPQPLHFAGVPEGIAPLTRQVLDYQGAVVRAAVEGDRRDLEVAILMDPIMRDIGKVCPMLDELLEANRGMVRPELLRS